MTDYDRYLSPYSWRYASNAMRELWSENHKRKLWRRIWLALAEAESEYGLVSKDQIAELKANVDRVDIDRALQIEAEIHHDLMAELKTYAEQCPNAGGIIHLGATSMDIEDNADAMRLKAGLALILERLDALLFYLTDLIEKHVDLAIMAYTHIQPAEPSTLGYRLAVYGQDLLEDRAILYAKLEAVKGKGFKGAVGTAASYLDLLGEENYSDFEENLSRKLDLAFYPIATQTYTRKQDYFILTALAGLAASLSRMAFDLRLLQTPAIAELSEPFGKQQVGSSAMPFKRNPINSEKIDSLARSLSVFPQIAWNNAATNLLERTLDDSANRRSMLPEAFLCADELLLTMTKLIKGLNVHEEAIARNLRAYGPFAATERVMLEAVRKGADRQFMHELLRKHALKVWAELMQGRPNNLVSDLQSDPELLVFLNTDEIASLMKVDTYIGIAPSRARDLAAKIRSTLRKPTGSWDSAKPSRKEEVCDEKS